MSRHHLVVALAALTFAIATACTTAASPNYEQLEQQLRDAGFDVVRGTIENPDIQLGDSSPTLRVRLHLACDGDKQRYFTMHNPPPSPLRLKTTYVAHPDPNLVKERDVSFTTQPTAAEIDTYDLCPHKRPEFTRHGDAEAAYASAGFHVVPGSLVLPGDNNNTIGPGTYVDLDLGCPDHQPRRAMRGELADLSLEFRYVTHPQPDIEMPKRYEFIGQPTQQQVHDFGLCYDPRSAW